MKTTLGISVLALLLAVASSPCFGMMEIALVSKERAKDLGLEVRSKGAGPGAVRVELEFATTGELKDFGRVDLEISEGDKLLLHATLREDRPKPGRALVGFAADRANLAKITLRIVVGVPMSLVGYDVRLKDFVDLKTAP